MRQRHSDQLAPRTGPVLHLSPSDPGPGRSVRWSPGAGKACSRRRSVRAPLSTAFLLALAALLGGCRDDRTPRLLQAELRDEVPDGVARQGESILLTLSRPLPSSVDLASCRVLFDPPQSVTTELQRGPGPQELTVKILAGSPELALSGQHGADAGAAGLGLDPGTGTVTWADLALAQSLPVLERVIWEDRSPANGGDLAVDRGDELRLLFDRPVRLAVEGEARRVVVPRDVLLAKSNSDRLDDGETPSRFEVGRNPNEVSIVLGSRPALNIAGSLPGSPEVIDRSRWAAPSGFALNGTRILPFRGITDVRGGPGVISTREVDIEAPERLPAPQLRPGQSFPPPGRRIFHTVTPLPRGRALVAGGSAAETREPLDQLIVYDPVLAQAAPDRALALSVKRLPRPTEGHSATLLAGPDGVPGTEDDVVAIVGGSDGVRTLAGVTLVASREGDNELEVDTIPDALSISRADHAAAAIGPNTLLVDGGRTSDPDGLSGFVGSAEILQIEYGPGGRPSAGRRQSLRTWPRSHHTATPLPPAENGSLYVLLLGGFGRARQQRTVLPELGQPVTGSTGVLAPQEAGAVLASPILLDVSSPEKSFELPGDLLFPILRWGHAAVPVEPRDGTAIPPTSERVLITGGTVRHPVRGFDGPRTLWERKLHEINLLDLARPQEHEAATPVLFRFDPTSPLESRFEVLRTSSPDPAQTPERLYGAAFTVAERGVVLAGGELRDHQALSSVELFLAEEDSVALLALPLATPRSRHQGYVVQRGPRVSLILLGGIPGPGATEPFADVEEVPVR